MIDGHRRKVKSFAAGYKLNFVVNRERVGALKHPEFVTDFDLDIAVVEYRLEQVAMWVVLRVLHLKLICLFHFGTDYGPEGLKLWAHSEDHVQEVDCVNLGVLFLLLLQLLDPNLLHTGLCPRVECLPHIDLYVLVVSEYLSAKLALMVAVDLPNDSSNSIYFSHGLDVRQLGNLDYFADIAHVDSIFLHDLAEVRTILYDEIQVV